MVVRRPLAPIGADRGQEGLGDGIAAAVHGHEVHARHPEDMRAGVARRRVLAVGVRRAPWGARGCCGGGGLGGERAARRAPRESLCAVCSALAQLGGGAIAAGERVLEDTAMRLAPGARQRQRDCVRRLLAARVAEGGERVRVARTGDDGAEDARPGVPRDIAERLGQRDMPLQERLVPVEDMGSPMLEEWGTRAEEGAQRHAVRVRPQRGRPQPRAVAGLHPLTVQDGTLAPRPARDGRGTEEATVQAAGCEGLAQRHPIDARGVPGDRLDVHGPSTSPPGSAEPQWRCHRRGRSAARRRRAPRPSSPGRHCRRLRHAG